MNKFLQERKAKYTDELIHRIVKLRQDIFVDGVRFKQWCEPMIGTVFYHCELYNISIYCTPACDQLLSGVEYPEDHNRVDISFSFVDQEGDETANFQVPLALTYHDVEVDAENWLQLVKAIITREMQRQEVAAA